LIRGGVSIISGEREYKKARLAIRKTKKKKEKE